MTVFSLSSFCNFVEETFGNDAIIFACRFTTCSAVFLKASTSSGKAPIISSTSDGLVSGKSWFLESIRSCMLMTRIAFTRQNSRNVASSRLPRMAFQNLGITSSSPNHELLPKRSVAFVLIALLNNAYTSEVIHPLPVFFQFVILGYCHDVTYLCHIIKVLTDNQTVVLSCLEKYIV